jgi:transposase
MGKNLRTKFVSMDVHQKSISIALADDGPDGDVRLYGTIKNTIEAIDRLIRKLVSTGAELHFVYEAGPCGFGLYRHLTGNGFRCIVAAPSMVPKKSGVRNAVSTCQC